MLQVDLVVRDAAIGGTMAGSFPYGWCLKNFMGWDADALSWDVGMAGGDGWRLRDRRALRRFWGMG